MSSNALFASIPTPADMEAKALFGSVEGNGGIDSFSYLAGYLHGLRDLGTVDEQEYDDLLMAAVNGTVARLEDPLLAPARCSVCGSTMLFAKNMIREMMQGEYDSKTDGFRCSNCKSVMLGGEPRYCPGCSAKIITEEA